MEPSAEQAAHVAELRPTGSAASCWGVSMRPREAWLAPSLSSETTFPSASPPDSPALAPAAAEPAADALAAAGVFADHRPLRFRHELWRGAVLAAMPAGEQASARAAAVRVLRERGAAAERIAAQLLKRRAARRSRCCGDLERGRRAGVGLRRARLRRGASAARARGASRSLWPIHRADGARRCGAEPRLRRGPRPFVDAGRIAPAPDRRRAAAIAAGHAAALDPARCQSALELLDAIDLPGGDRASTARVLNARLAAAWTDIGRFHAIAVEAQALEPIAGATVDERRLLAHLARARLEAGASAAEVSELAERATDDEPGTMSGG